MGFASLIVYGYPFRAGSGARACLAVHLGQPDHRAGLVLMRDRDTALDGGGNDRLVDALVAHGSCQDVETAVARLRAPGADHMADIPLAPQGSPAGWVDLEAMGPPS